MKLLDMPLVEGGVGEVVSAEALTEGQQEYHSMIAELERDHDWDGKGGLAHLSPSWAHAVAMLEVDVSLVRPAPAVQVVWSEGFKVQPHATGVGRIEWELERTRPQLIQLGITTREDPWPYNFERDVQFENGSSNGKGWLRFWTENLAGIEQHAAYEAINSITRILLVVRVF